MAHGGIVASNDAVSKTIQYWRGLLNGGSQIHLFQNAFVPSVASVLEDFTEANFTGYAAEDISGLIDFPSIVMDGEWHAATPTVTFSCTGGTSQQIYGFYLTQTDGDVLWFSQAFSAAIVMSPGASFSLQLDLQEWALCIA